MRPGEFHRLAYRIFQAANAGKLWAPGWCYGCGHASSDLRWWIVSTDDPWNTTYQLCGLCLLSWRIDKQAREKIKTMTTFSQWLTGHETGPSDDPVAWLARQWKACEGNRPKVSSPTGIEKHLTKPAVAEQIFAGDPEIFIKGVHDAIASATDRYRADKAREQAGLPATSSGETTAPAGDTNPATGKPVAVVGSRSWIEHPLASKFGTCETCGWPIGVADASKLHPAGSGKVLTCAAGHYINQATGETVVLSGPLTTTVGPGGGGAGTLAGGSELPVGHADRPDPDAAQIEADAQRSPGGLASRMGADQGVIARLGRIELMLTALCATLGLPGDNPDALASLIAAAAETDGGEPDSGLLSQQLAGEIVMIPDEAQQTMQRAARDLHGLATPADFASWYGMADPAAQGGESDG